MNIVMSSATVYPPRRETSLTFYRGITRDSSTSLGMTENKAPLFRTLEVYHDVSSRSAPMNMAIDEALLESTRNPCIRFYGWDHAALSFGYFGKFSDIAEEERSRDLVRRWTGGGIVRHDTDLTYGLVIPVTPTAEIPSPLDIYQKIHSALCYVFMESGLHATLIEETMPKISDVCFASPVRADVVIDGKKIAGAAQRRARRGFLQQGSIRYEQLPENFADRFASSLSHTTRSLALRDEIAERAEEIAQQKYAQRSWLERR
jgi:lipoyl(octanoyl) transferase